MTGPAAVERTDAERIDSPAFERILEVLSGGVTAVLTGAGVSTDSGIPDYRGEGAPRRTPMTFQHFLGDDDYRRRYWAGSELGWTRFSTVRPNAGHGALARLEAAGRINGVVTQNVDGLHVRAGSRHVVDLHGSMSRVRCLTCGQEFSRDDVGDRIRSLNPWIVAPSADELGPDGDVVPERLADFSVPDCSNCGGMLKPDIVFFGEFVPADKFAQASALVDRADALLVAGSSLVVNSGIRLLERARRRRIPALIVNRGETRGDARAEVKLDAGASEVLTALADRLGA